jgi:hypothetical protein
MRLKPKDRHLEAQCISYFGCKGRGGIYKQLTNRAVTVFLVGPDPSADVALREGEGKGKPGEGNGASPEGGS